MNPFMTRASMMRVLVLSVCLLVFVGAAERAQGTIHRGGGIDPVANVWIDAHTIENVVYGIDEIGPTTNIKSEDVSRVDYVPSQDPQVLRATGLLNSGKFADVLPFYERIIKRGNVSQHDLTQAHLGRARALQRLGRLEEAGTALQEFIAEFDNAFVLLEAYQLLFNVYLAQENIEAGETLLNEVDKKAKQQWFKVNKTYHDEAGIVVSYGRAKILAENGSYGQAATAIDNAIVGINPQDRPQLWREAATLRASSFEKAGDVPNAIRSWRALVFQPIGGQRQALAMVALAKLNHQAGEVLQAYDLVCRAAVREGVGEATKKEAGTLARKYAKELEAQDDIPVEIRKVYSLYARSL